MSSNKPVRSRARVRLPSIDQTIAPPPSDWVQRGSCSGMCDLLDFFSDEREQWKLAKQICERCPVKRECLQYSLDSEATHGVWGGRDQLERRYALGRDAQGNAFAFARGDDVKCLWCRSATTRGEPVAVTRSTGYEVVVRTCTSEECGMAWRRTEKRQSGRGRKKTTSS